MNRRRTRAKTIVAGEAGFALLTVLIFALIVGIVGTAFFAMASMENRNAHYREDSSEAFYLADGAIEQARGAFLDDISWRGPIPPTSLGNGSYDLVAVDSTWTDGQDAVYLRAEGHVGGADRAVEAWVRLRPSGGEHFIVMNDMDASHGNFCLDGHVHVNNEADFGKDDTHLKCGGTYTEGFVLYPPAAHTEPSYFPGSTYYYVYGDPINTTKSYVYKYDPILGDTVDVTGSINDLYQAEVYEFDPKTNRFVYNFRDKVKNVAGKPWAWEYYFSHSGNQFVPDVGAGDSSVVVNFGEVWGQPARLSDVLLKQTANNVPLQSTLINTRFTGASDADRLDSKKWTGGSTAFWGHTRLAPLNCIALIIHDVDFGNAQVELGTPAQPALTYITHDVVKINGQLSIEGTMIVLHDFFSTGGPDVTFNGGFLDCLPPEWLLEFNDDGSAVMVLLEWKEVPATG